METIEQNDEYELDVVPHIRGGKILGYTKDITVAESIKDKYEDNDKFYVTITEASEVSLEY